MSELLPCPFCGSREDSPIESVVQLCHNEYHREHNPEGDWWTVQCDNCTATMGQFTSPDEAIDAWNTRAKDLPQGDEVERVAEVIAPHLRQSYFNPDTDDQAEARGFALQIARKAIAALVRSKPDDVLEVERLKQELIAIRVAAMNAEDDALDVIRVATERALYPMLHTITAIGSQP